MNMFMHWLLSALVIGLAAYLLPGVEVTIVGALLAAIVLGLLNIFIRPILMILTLPINIVTLGLFSFVINAGLILITTMVVPGFAVSGFWYALLLAIVLSLFNLFFGLGPNRS